MCSFTITNMVGDVIAAIVVAAINANFTAVVVFVVVADALILAVLISEILRSLLFAGPLSLISLVAGVCSICIRHCILIYIFRPSGPILKNFCMGILVSCIRSDILSLKVVHQSSLHLMPSVANSLQGIAESD